MVVDRKKKCHLSEIYKYARKLWEQTYYKKRKKKTQDNFYKPKESNMIYD